MVVGSNPIGVRDFFLAKNWASLLVFGTICPIENCSKKLLNFETMKLAYFIQSRIFKDPRALIFKDFPRPGIHSYLFKDFLGFSRTVGTLVKFSISFVSAIITS